MESNLNDDAKQNQQPKIKQLNVKDQSYFQLMQLVGSDGKYQKYSLIIWCLIWFLGGQLLLGSPLLLYNVPYTNCPNSLSPSQCTRYVCSVPYSKRQSYLSHKPQTLATSFGDYHCQQSFKIQLATTLIYMGSCLGYIVVSLLNDNLGRKKSMQIALSVMLVGLLIVGVSWNLAIAQLGLFFTGFGIDSSINTALYFISETVQNTSRQKHSVIIQSFFSLGGIANVIYYLIFGNWRLIFWIFFIFPAVIILVLVFKFIQETPQFLVMLYSPQQALNALKKISLINNGEFLGVVQNQQLLLNHIIYLKQEYLKKSSISSQKVLTPLALFKYRSIRSKSLCVFILSFSIYLMYYGPLMLIQKYQLSVYVSTIVVVTSQIIVYPIFYYNVSRMKRRMFAMIFFAIAIVCATGLSFVVGTKKQSLKVIQMILIFVFRFSISFQFALFLIYCNQLFPSQLRGLGIGFSSALGTIASTSSPILFGQLSKTNFPIMSIFIVFGIFSQICTFYLPQTMDKPLTQQILQFGQKPQQKIENKLQQNKNKTIQMQLVQEMDDPLNQSPRNISMNVQSRRQT